LFSFIFDSLSFILSLLYNHLLLFFFFFNDTATTEIYTLSLHDALPISFSKSQELWKRSPNWQPTGSDNMPVCRARRAPIELAFRSEEHTSELQSRGHLVCRLLLEKKKQKREER